MARQLCCRGMCKNLLRSDGKQQSYGKAKFPSNLNCGQKNVSETGPRPCIHTVVWFWTVLFKIWEWIISGTPKWFWQPYECRKHETVMIKSLHPILVMNGFWKTIMLTNKQGKSEGFDSCDRPSNLKLDSNRQFFCPCDREIWWMTL